MVALGRSIKERRSHHLQFSGCDWCFCEGRLQIKPWDFFTVAIDADREANSVKASVFESY